MSIFDDQQQKKPQKQPRAPRIRTKPNEPKNLQQLQKSILFPELKIKCYGQTNNQQYQQPLQGFVQQMYKQFQAKKHSKVIQSFQKQNDQGNVEYKLKLVNPTEDRLDHLATQMKYRVKQGSGQGYYRIGVEDNGKPLGLEKHDMLESLKTICYIASKIHTEVMVLRVSEGIKGLIIQLMIRQVHKQGIKLEIRILLLGDSGSGKSTLLGMLKSGQKDDGKGKCRLKVVTHPEQLITGVTMTKSHHVVGFDSQGKLVNQQNMLSLQKWFDQVNKLLSFIDVGGHKKAQKQLISCLCSFFPQYALWVISGKQSPKTSSKFDTDNLQLAKVFNLPLIVVITHLDEMTKDQQIQVTYNLKQFLKKLYPDKTPCIIKQMQYAVLFSRITSTQDVIPIFLVSSVTGKNVDLLSSFLNLLTSVSQIKNNEELHTEFLISDKYFLENKIILAGTVIKGSIKKGQILHLGPDLKGSFRAVQVNSIECLRVPVKFAKCGQICTIGIKLNNFAKQWLQKQPNAIRRGMVLIQSKSNPRSAHQFSAQFVLYHSNKQQIKITRKHQPVVNTLTIRQICNIISVLNKKNKEQDFLQIPTQMIKKKSKSIDNFDKYHSSSLSKTKIKNKKNSSSNLLNHSMMNGLHKQELEGNMNNRKPIYKKSLDLTQSQLKQIQTYSPLVSSHSYMNTKSTEQIKVSQFLSQSTKKQNPLQTIQEQIIKKKKKQLQQIVITQNQPITLRLRFKYMPEYITMGQIIVISELKLVGKIKEIYY